MFLKIYTFTEKEISVAYVGKIMDYCNNIYNNKKICQSDGLFLTKWGGPWPIMSLDKGLTTQDQLIDGFKTNRSWLISINPRCWFHGVFKCQ